MSRVYGRRAFGPGKKMTLAEKARAVAHAIHDKELHGHDWRWESYGLEHNEPQIIRVMTALQQLRAQEGHA
jgi:hypothetical protein